MIKILRSATILGVEAKEIRVEIDAANGLPGECIVGLADKVIKESKNRIKSAIKNSEFKYPVKFFTINLSPAELPKEGPLFDLPIAAGILATTKQINIKENSLFIGELSLDGSVLPIRGILPICIMAKKRGIRDIYLPKKNIKEAMLIPELQLYPINHLKDLKSPLRSISYLNKHQTHKQINYSKDFIEVKGQTLAKRAIEISVSGWHHLLLKGPPGSGKTMLAERIPSIMPQLNTDEFISCLSINSIFCKDKIENIHTTKRPFRSPHHSSSFTGMVGGGNKATPGEITLAHNGVLFLDEFPEFQRKVIEVLREPFEKKEISLSRANYHVTFPANFLFIGAMNPCPCGYLNDEKKQCSCTAQSINNYQKKISGPIYDRIDLKVDVPRVKPKDLLSSQSNSHYSSSEMNERILKAHQIQLNRYQSNLKNAYLSSSQLDTFCTIPNTSKLFLANEIDRGIITTRSKDKVIKIARTIADLESEKEIQHSHILEALFFIK